MRPRRRTAVKAIDALKNRADDKAHWLLTVLISLPPEQSGIRDGTILAGHGVF